MGLVIYKYSSRNVMRMTWAKLVAYMEDEKRVQNFSRKT
jgi:hypothetical protein